MPKYKSATLSELIDSLTKLLNKYPELADKKVSISTEYGYSNAEIASPVELYGFTTSDSIIHILTNDDIDVNKQCNINSYKIHQPYITIPKED